MPDHLPCGCRKDASFICYLHRRRWWGDVIASDPAALIGLALFISMVLIWADIFTAK